LVARFLQVGADHGLGVFGDAVAGQPHQAGRPLGQHSVAAGRSPKFLFLIERELTLEAPFTIVEGGHVIPKAYAPRRPPPYRGRARAAIETRLPPQGAASALFAPHTSFR